MWQSSAALGALVAVLVATVPIARRLERSKRARGLVAMAALPAVVWAGAGAARDANGFLTFAVHEPLLPDPARTARTLRAFMDTVSTRDDRVLSTPDNPVHLYRALRGGWVPPMDNLVAYFAEAKWDLYLAQRIRFFVHYPSYTPLPPPLRGQRPMGEGPGWAVYCLDPRGCPPIGGGTAPR
jgi:hypothetical protein